MAIMPALQTGIKDAEIPWRAPRSLLSIIILIHRQSCFTGSEISYGKFKHCREEACNLIRKVKLAKCAHGALGFNHAFG